MTSRTGFGLIHSPLVGPYTWALVAGELERRSYPVARPALRANETAEGPYWQRHADAAASQIDEALPDAATVILVAHSGAGSLLPHIGKALNRGVRGYIFADALLPHPGESRLATFGSPEAAFEFRSRAVDGYLPAWTAEELKEVIPTEHKRQRLASELRPLPLAVYEEPIPDVSGWPDAPCGYLQLSDTYRVLADEAGRRGWVVRALDGQHFHMLVDPLAVTRQLLEIVSLLGAI